MQNKDIISEDTKNELKAIIAPKNQHSNLAKLSIEFMADEMDNDNPAVDIGTIRKFIDFLITKGYN